MYDDLKFNLSFRIETCISTIERERERLMFNELTIFQYFTTIFDIYRGRNCRKLNEQPNDISLTCRKYTARIERLPV